MSEVGSGLPRPEVRSPLEKKERPVKPAYEGSRIVKNAREQLERDGRITLHFFDIDATLTQSPEIAQQVREKIDQMGHAAIAVTSRTEEMVMRRGQYEASQAAGHLLMADGRDRPAPQLRKVEPGPDDPQPPRLVEAFPEEVPEAHGLGLSGFSIIAAQTGGRIYVEHETSDGTGYVRDWEYDKSVKQEGDGEIRNWRSDTVRLLKDVFGEEDLQRVLHPLEIEGRYERGEEDVLSTDLRVQLNFAASKATAAFGTGNTAGGVEVDKPNAEVALEARKQFKRKLLRYIGDVKKKEREHPGSVDPETLRIIRNVRITDDSNPKYGRFSLYVTPMEGNKLNAVETIVTDICGALDLKDRSKITFNYYGDSFPDLNAGILGGEGTQGTLVLVGDSRLNEPLNPDSGVEDFAGERITGIKARLKPTEKPGYYTWHRRLSEPDDTSRKVVIGSKAYPGTAGPETILKFLNDQAPQPVAA